MANSDPDLLHVNDVNRPFSNSGGRSKVLVVCVFNWHYHQRHWDVICMCVVNLDKQNRKTFRLLKAGVGPPSTRQIIRFPLSLSSITKEARQNDRG